MAGERLTSIPAAGLPREARPVFSGLIDSVFAPLLLTSTGRREISEAKRGWQKSARPLNQREMRRLKEQAATYGFDWEKALTTRSGRLRNNHEMEKYLFESVALYGAVIGRILNLNKATVSARAINLGWERHRETRKKLPDTSWKNTLDRQISNPKFVDRMIKKVADDKSFWGRRGAFKTRKFLKVLHISSASQQEDSIRIKRLTEKYKFPTTVVDFKLRIKLPHKNFRAWFHKLHWEQGISTNRIGKILELDPETFGRYLTRKRIHHRSWGGRKPVN